MSETGIGYHTERPTPAMSREGARMRNPSRETFETYLSLKTNIDERGHAFSEQGKRQLDLVEDGSALPIQETQRVMNGARSQETRLEAEVAGVAETAEQKRKSLFRKWMENPIFKMGVISAAIHGTLIAKGMSMPEEMKEEIPQTVLQPQSVAEMEKVDAQRAERETRIDHQAVADYKQSIRERMDRGESVSFEELYFELERLNGIPESDIVTAKQKAEDLTNQFSVEMIDGISEGELNGFVGTMYSDLSSCDEGQGSTAVYFNTGKHNCVSFARGLAIVLEKVIRHMPPERQAWYRIGIEKVAYHQIATLAIHDPGRQTDRVYLLEPIEPKGNLRVIDGAEEEPGSKNIPLDDLKRTMVAEKPVEMNASGGSFDPGPTVIHSTDQPVDDGIVIRGSLRGSEAAIAEAKQKGIEPVEVKQHDWGTTELSQATPEEEAEFERSLKHGEYAELRSRFEQSKESSRFVNGVVLGMWNANQWFNVIGPISANHVKKINEWMDQDGIKQVYHGALHEFDDAAIKELPNNNTETVSVLFLPDDNTEQIEVLLDAAEGRKGPMIELQIREYEQDTQRIVSHSAAAREEIRRIVSRKNLGSIALVFKRFSVYRMEPDPNIIQKKYAEMNRLNSRTAYDIANGKVKDVYLSGRKIAPGDLLVLEHGKARVHIDTAEYMELLLNHPELLGSENIVPWLRTNVVAFSLDPEFAQTVPKPVMDELIRLQMASYQLPQRLPDEPHAGMDY